MNPLTAQQITRHQRYQAPRREATVLFRHNRNPLQFIRNLFTSKPALNSNARLENA